MKNFLVFFALLPVVFTGEVDGSRQSKDSLRYDKQDNSWGSYKDYDGDEWEDKVTYEDQYGENDNKYGKNDNVNEREIHSVQNNDKEAKNSYIEQGRVENQGNEARKKYKEENRERKTYGIYDVQKYEKDNNDEQNDYYDKNSYSTYKEQDWGNQDDINDDVNIVGLGKNDREDLIRPCALDDWQCIRKYFADNAKCSPTYGPVPDPLYLKRSTLYYPRFNITQVLTRVRITGMGSIKISEFYVNIETGNLVIALKFKNLNETILKAYYRYKRTAKESIVLNDYTTIEFRSGTFTAVIPKIPHLRLDLAEIHADIDDGSPNYFVGPEAANSTDPDVIVAFAELIANLPTAIREAFLFRSQLLTAIYIQENICDFGLKLTSI